MANEGHIVGFDAFPKNPHEVRLSLQNIKRMLPNSTYDATRKPDGNDDITKGHKVGSNWLTTSDTGLLAAADQGIYRCFANTEGAAQWRKMAFSSDTTVDVDISIHILDPNAHHKQLHAETHTDLLGAGLETPDLIDGDQLIISWDEMVYYTRDSSASMSTWVNDDKQLTAHLKGIDMLLGQHAERHTDGGGDSIDGDRVDIDWNPANYTPTVDVGQVHAQDPDDLAAHLNGIDLELATFSVTTHTHAHIDLTGIGTDDHHAEDHQSRHLYLGADRIEGDHLRIEYSGTNYTSAPDPGGESVNALELTSHLYGIDVVLGTLALASHTHEGTEILSSGPVTDGYVLTADGIGGAAWVVSGSGGATVLLDLTDVNTSTPTSGHILRADGVDWESVLGTTYFADVIHTHAASDIVSGTLAHERGGLEFDASGVVEGDLIVGTGTGTFSILTKGSDNQILRMNGNAIGWETASGGVAELSDLTDVATSTPTSGHILMADGVDWHSIDSSTQFAIVLHAHELDELDASGIAVGKLLNADGAGNAYWSYPGFADHLFTVYSGVDPTKTVSIVCSNITTGTNRAINMRDGTVNLAGGTDGQVLTVQADGTADWENVPGGGGSDTFSTINCPTGTDPVASGSDTLNLKADSTKISIVGDSSVDNVTFDVVEGEIDHGALKNHVDAEHIDWSASVAETIHDDNYTKGGPGTDTTAVHVDELNEYVGAGTEKTTLHGGDRILIEDSLPGGWPKKYAPLTAIPNAFKGGTFGEVQFNDTIGFGGIDQSVIYVSSSTAVSVKLVNFEGPLTATSVFPSTGMVRNDAPEVMGSDNRRLCTQESIKNYADYRTPLTQTGDLLTREAGVNVRFPIGGTDGHVLTVNSAADEGMAWAAPGGVAGLPAAHKDIVFIAAGASPFVG